MKSEEAGALVSTIGREKKKLTSTQIVILKDLAQGHELADKMIAPIAYKNPNELTLSPNNIRKTVNEYGLQRLITSIREVGVLVPIFINTKNQVVVGQLRWLAAKRLNLASIPCIVRKYTSDREEMFHSFFENDTAIPLSDEEVADAIRILHDEGKRSFGRIARAFGRSENAIKHYYELGRNAD